MSQVRPFHLALELLGQVHKPRLMRRHMVIMALIYKRHYRQAAHHCVMLAHNVQSRHLALIGQELVRVLIPDHPQAFFGQMALVKQVRELAGQV